MIVTWPCGRAAERVSDAMWKRSPSTPGSDRHSRQESDCAFTPVDDLCGLQKKASRATIYTLELKERRRRKIKRAVAMWPVALGVILGCLAPQIHHLVAHSTSWAMWAVFPFAVLAARTELHLGGQLASIVPLAALYAQFPIEGLLVRIILRNRVTVPDVAREVFLLHFLGAVELGLISGVLPQLLMR